MSDDQKEKPKVTLIKQKKTDIPSSSEPQGDDEDKKDKKKVVVVKKKVVVKKSPRVVVRSSSSGEDNTQEQEQESSKNFRQKTDNARPAPQQGSREYRGSQNRTYNRSSGPGNRDTRKPPYRSNYSGDNRYQGRSSSDGNRNYSGQNDSRGVRRPGGNYNRPQQQQQQRPRNYSGGNKPGSFGKPPFNKDKAKAPAPAASNLQDGQKHGAKKFYKSKKTKEYPKKKDENSEKKFIEYKKKASVQSNPVPKEIDIMEVITVSDLAKKMNLKASDLISKLMSMGMMVTINQQIDAETAEILADEYHCKVKIVSLYDETIIESEDDENAELEARPPIVTIMGHVDHGKTKLLDAIRNTDVVSGEFGGITQHIGAYTVSTPKGNITFLDTPGHAAFTMMRARGAQVTDIVIIVVAATEGVMPQTVEAINHAKAAGVPIIVAINKMDLADANPDRIMQQLSEYELMPEEWGGHTQFIKISALKGEGLDRLLEAIILESEMLELKANWKCKAEGKIIESKVDQGRGIIATVLVERGVLKIGDSFVAGIYPGKVRAMFNDKGYKVDKATPSMPVEILGFTGIPNSGDPFQVAENDKMARQFGIKRQELKKVEEAKNVKKITLANLYDSIQEGETKELKVIIKGDVHGSVEALKSALEKLSTSEIKLTCINAAAGAIVENDINLAITYDAIVIGFHVRPTPKAQTIAEKEKVEIRKYNIIYDVVEDIKSAMEGLLSPDLQEDVIGHVEIRETFKVPKVGTIAGCMVTDGKINRKSNVNVIRDGIVIHTGKISSLKRFKDDVKDVMAGYECGLSVENFNDIQIGDELEVFEIREVSRKLGDPVANG